MANKTKTTETNPDAYLEYLNKNGVSQQICDCLLKLIKNKPDQPMLFLANYFDSCTDKTGKVANALRLLTYTRNSPSVFEANLLQAFDALCTSKPPGSKKVSSKPGLIGCVYESFLKSIFSTGLDDIENSFLNIVTCRSNEVVPFDVFRYGVYACFFFNDYINECKKLFELLTNKESNNFSDKALCEIFFTSFNSAITTLLNRDSKAPQFLEAGFQLSPHKLAVEMLNSKESKSGIAHMSEKDFLVKLSELLMSNMKELQ